MNGRGKPGAGVALASVPPAPSVHFSSASDLWGTPQGFYAGVRERFGPFDLDAAASASNAKAPRWYTEADDGLVRPWFGGVWCNPPYSQIAAWIERCALQAWSGSCRRVVALPPARTGTAWWHTWVMRAELVCLVDGRLVFNGHARPTAKNPTRGHGPEGDLECGSLGCADSAPFPSAVVVWGRQPAEPRFVAMDRRGRLGKYRRLCPGCGDHFRASRSDASTCSSRCRRRLSPR